MFDNNAQNMLEDDDHSSASHTGSVVNDSLITCLWNDLFQNISGLWAWYTDKDLYKNRQWADKSSFALYIVSAFYDGMLYLNILIVILLTTDGNWLPDSQII